MWVLSMLLESFLGLPDTVLQKAAAKSGDFERSYCKTPNSSTDKWEEKASLIIINLVKIAASKGCSALTDNIVVSLANLQHKARLLLEH